MEKQPQEFVDEISILLIDDDKDEYIIISSLLDRIKDMEYRLEWIPDYQHALAEMIRNRFDIYLIDYRLGSDNGLELMREARLKGCYGPKILLTGQGDREIDIAAMKAGASDYMLKNQLHAQLLERSIRYAIERRKAQLALQESEERYRDLLDNANDMIVNMDPQGGFIYVNNVWFKTLNYGESESRKMNILDIIYPDQKREFQDVYKDLLSGKNIELLETAFITKQGLKVDVQGNLNSKYDSSGDIISIRAIFRDVSARRKAERERDRIFELSRDLIAILNYEGEFIDLNPSWTRVLGYDISNIAIQNILKLIHPDDIHLIRRKIKKLKENIPVHPIEIRFKREDSSYKWFSLSITLEEKEKRLYIFARDITDIKKSQIELEESEKRYRNLIEYNRGLIFTHDLSGKILSVNKAVSETIGYSVDDMVGQNLEKYFFPEDKRKLNRYLANIRKKRVVHGTIDLKNREGQLITLAYRNFKYKQHGGIEYIIGNAQDITDRVLAEKALMRERQQLRDTIENAPVPMALLDNDLKFITCSKRWLVDYKPKHVKTIIGNTYFELYPWLDSKWVQYMHRCLDGEILSKSEDIFNLPNNGYIYIRWAMHPWRDKKGDVNGVIIVAERIDDLVKARNEAELANKAKSTFLANVTHELRTPLNAILGYSQILAKDQSITEYQKEYIDNMYRSGMHLLNMINDILDLSKIEAGKTEINLEDVNLHDLLDEIYNLFILRSREKGLGYRIYKSENLPIYIRTDIGKLRQMLINIISNSMKYTDNGSITIHVNENGGKNKPGFIPLCICITDTGIGIPESQLNNIFEPFVQVAGENSEGTGLGLSISRGLARLLGGDIIVESEWKVGSEFKLYLPVKAVDKPAISLNNKFSRVKAIEGDDVYRVLIVDDVEYNRTVLRVMLSQVGFECEEVSSGSEAITKCEIFKPNIIFIDKHLSDTNGIEVMKKIRAMDTMSDTVIFALSASGVGDSRSSYINMGFNDFLRKPFTEEEIFELIHKHTNVHYIFEDEQMEEKTITEIIQDTIREIEKLPEELKTNLKDALEWQDMEELNWLVKGMEKVTNENNIAAKRIKNAVHRSDYFFITMLNKSMNN